MTWTFVTDENTRELQLRGGQIQVDEFPPFNSIDKLKKTPGVTMSLFPSTRTDYLDINELYPPLKDVHVRRAISYAIDRASIVKSVLFGYGTPANSLLPPQVPYYDKNAGGLQYDDVTHVYNMGFPEMLTAMQNGAIDAAPVPEPFNTFGREQGIGVRFSAEEFYPRQTVAVVLYGPDFMTKRKDIAHRFMTAYLKGVRFYNDAIRDGHFAGPRAEELIDLLVKETRYKDAALYKKMVPNGCDPDGKVDRPSLETDLAFWRANKFVEDDKIGVADVLDNSYVEAALKIVGPYTPA